MNEKNQKIDEIKQRILYFAEKQEIKRIDLYKKIGLSQSNFSGLGAKSSLKSENIVKVLIVFRNLNPDWLLLGNGEMLRNPANVNAGNGQQVIADHNSGTIHADNRQYYSDSPDVLRREIELLNEWIKEKDGHIKEKDGQIKEKDGQISKLLALLGELK